MDIEQDFKVGDRVSYFDDCEVIYGTIIGLDNKCYVKVLFDDSEFGSIDRKIDFLDIECLKPVDYTREQFIRDIFVDLHDQLYWMSRDNIIKEVEKLWK